MKRTTRRNRGALPQTTGAPDVQWLCGCGKLTESEGLMPICECGHRTRFPHITNASDRTYCYVVKAA